MGIDAASAQHIETASRELPGRLVTCRPDELRPSGLPPSVKQAEGDREALHSAFNSTGQNPRGHPVVRSPEQLHPHPALVRLNLMDSVVELNEAIRMKGRFLREPILITTNGTIISGFRDWYAAVSDASPAVDCIEYSLSDEEAIVFILVRHQPRRTWNSFNRIRLALDLEPYFQLKALANQSAGGKYKGSANLPQAEQIDVRQEIARVAAVGGRNVTNVKTILQKADPRLIEALHGGTLSIHRAAQWCSLPRAQQVEQFGCYSVERSTSKVIRQAIARHRTKRTEPDPVAVLNALQQQEAREPGSLVVRAGRSDQTVILLGRDLLNCLHRQADLDLA